MSELTHIYLVYEIFGTGPVLGSTPIAKITDRQVRVKADSASRWRRAFPKDECDFSPRAAWNRYILEKQCRVAGLQASLVEERTRLTMAEHELQTLEGGE